MSFQVITMSLFGVVTGVHMNMCLQGIITLFLVVLYLVSLKSHGVEAKMNVEPIEEDLEFERQLKILNKPPLKTIRTEDGDIFDCVDIHKQPAFDHPLLKDHEVQVKPSFIPRGETNKTLLAANPLQITFKRKECPQGTVPIRRTSKEDLLRARALSREFATNVNQSNKHFPGQYIADVNSNTFGVFHGASAFISVYNPIVEPLQFTNAQIWINGGPNENPNYIMAGWTVNPELYGDHLTRLFTYWTAGGYHNGCYNTLCAGFVQVDRSWTPTDKLPLISTIGGTQYEVKVYVYQDRNTGNWWLVISNHNIHLGYWPKSLFTYLADGANSVSWGGLAKAGPNGKSPPMGSGRFPRDSYPCHFRRLEYVDTGYKIYPMRPDRIKTRLDGKNCYGIRYGDQKKDYRAGIGDGFTFGGPGGNNCY